MKKTVVSLNNVDVDACSLRKARLDKAWYFVGKIKHMMWFIYRHPNMQQRTSRALRYIMPYIVTDQWPVLSIDYSKVLMTWGILEPASLYAVTTQPGELKFTWRDNSGEGNARPDDMAFLIVYCEALDRFTFTCCRFRRKDCKGIFRVAEFRGYEVYAWLSFKSADEMRVSESVYVGRVGVL